MTAMTPLPTHLRAPDSTTAQLGETAAEIVVVDDTPANLKLLASLLSEQGYRIRPASSGALALRSVHAKTPDLILLDVRMPELDGYAFCRQLKADPHTCAIPVIFISALNESADKVQSFSVGGVDFITKPFEPAEVLARVKTHLELRRLQQELERRVEARTADLAQTHHALQVSEERLRRVIEATSDGVWDWNLRSGEMFFSDHWYTMLGYAPGDLEASHAAWRDLLHPDDAAPAEAAIRAHLDGQSPELNLELRMRARNGDWQWVHNRGKVIERTAAGEALRMVGTQADIAARKQAEEQLERYRTGLEERVAARTAELDKAREQLLQSEKLAALGHLVAGMAHELNTPLGNARTMAGALDEHLRQFAAAVSAGTLRQSQLDAFLSRCREAVDLLERNTARAANLIAQFKEIAVDQSSLRRRRFDLRRTIEQIVFALQPQFERAAHRVELEIPDELMLDSYPGPLEQVIANLVGNSLTHGFVGMASGLIGIRAAPLDATQIEIEYSDNGAGVPEAIRHRIFEPFFTTRLGSGGSGLGLYVTHTLVTGTLGGTIRLVDRRGPGASFRLTLPLSAPERPNAEPAA
ncbi:response regulator [Accumulibacter sp.]|uniref:hybrid sensor histidine kinase/response regulator n=1 Tax=Accumulibacter sp. TaxID=2053492 RepID=UPI002630E747|nr:response regulator [Accumulibacter sp.]